jgi:hypothetical protein
VGVRSRLDSCGIAAVGSIRSAATRDRCPAGLQTCHCKKRVLCPPKSRGPSCALKGRSTNAVGFNLRKRAINIGGWTLKGSTRRHWKSPLLDDPFRVALEGGVGGSGSRGLKPTSIHGAPLQGAATNGKRGSETGGRFRLDSCRIAAVQWTCSATTRDDVPGQPIKLPLHKEGAVFPEMPQAFLRPEGALYE